MVSPKLLLLQEHVDGTGAAVVRARGREGEHVTRKAVRPHPAFQGFLEDGDLVLGVQSAAVDDQHAAPALLAGFGEE